MDAIPTEFSRSVPVPGLVDMAAPAFVEPGPKVAKRDAIPQKDPRRDAFWYRRIFTVEGPIPDTATLKVAKAMFGTRVFLNGQLLGDHVPCWTPGYFNAKSALKPGENEVVIRVGADRDAIGRAYPDGFDFEKARYIPGIFDSVSLALSGTPRIENVQVAPDIAGQRAKVRVYLDGSQATGVEVEIREAKSGPARRQRRRERGGGRPRMGRDRPDRGLPSVVAGRPVPLPRRRTHAGRRIPDAVRDARVSFRPGHPSRDAQRQAVFHARQQLHPLSLFRGC